MSRALVTTRIVWHVTIDASYLNRDEMLQLQRHSRIEAPSPDHLQADWWGDKWTVWMRHNSTFAREGGFGGEQCFVCDIYYINSSPCILVFFGGVVFFFWEAANITTLCAVISTNGMLCHIPTSGPNIIERQITFLFSLLHKINSPESAYCGGLAWLLMLSFGFRHSRLVNEWFAAQPCLTKLFLPCTLPVLHSDRGNILSIDMEEVWSPAEQRDVGNSLYHFKIQTHNSPI